MCLYCFAALGTVVGGTALAKAGGLGAAKLALAAWAGRMLFFRR